MKKMYAAIAGAVVVALVAVIAVLGISQESGYEIVDSGRSYAADGTAVSVTPGARFDFQGDRAVITQDGRVTSVDSSRLIRVEDGSIRLLNSTVAVTPDHAIRDLVSKSLVARDQLDGYTVTSPVLDSQPALATGSVIKPAADRYLLLDTATVVRGDGDAAQTVQTLGSESVVALDGDGTARFLDGDTVTEQPNDRLRVVLDTTGAVIDLSSQLMSDPVSGAEIDLSQILVRFDDSPVAGAGAAQATAEPETPDTPTSEPTTDAAGTGDGTTGSTGTAGTTGTGSDSGTGSADDGSSALPELPEIADGRSQVPAVLLTADAPRDVIEVAAQVSDVAASLRGLRVEVLAADGSVEQSADLGTDAGTQAWTSDAFPTGSQHVVRLSGSYLDATGAVQEAVFATVPVTIGALGLTSTTTAVGATEATLALTATHAGDLVTELALDVRENRADAPVLGTVTVPVDALRSGGTAEVPLTGLSPQTSYLVQVASARADDAELSSTWSTVVSTRSRTLTVDGVEAGYGAAAQQFTLALTGLHDPDQTLTQVRYLAFDATEYAASGLSATVRASLIVGAERAGQQVTLDLPTSMPQGSYVWVAVITANDGVDDAQVVAGPSAEVAVSAKHVPQALFALQKATADTLAVQYVVNDPDGTIVLDGSTHPVAQLVEVNADGDVVAIVSTVDLLTAAESAGGLLQFDGLEALTTYQVRITASYDIGDGTVPNAQIGVSEVFSTTDVDPVSVTFRNPDATLTTTSAARIAFQLNDSGEALTTAQLLVSLTSTGAEVSRTDLSGLLANSLTPDWALVDLTGLQPDTRYTLTVVDATDSGQNPVPVAGSYDLLTRKRTPAATTVTLSADLAASTLTAQLKNGSAAVSDPDGAVSTVTYQLLDADNPGAGPLAERTASASGASVTFPLLQIDGAGRGRTYLVRAVMSWLDNYDTGSLTLDSDVVDVPKSGPVADLTFLSRDADTLSVRVTVTDPDGTMTSDPVLEIDGSSTALHVGAQDVTVAAGSAALTVRVLADYRVLASDPVTEDAVLFTSALAAVQSPTDTPSVQVAWNGGRTVAVTPTAGSSLSGITLDTATSVTAVGAGAPDWSGTAVGAQSYAAQLLTLPQGTLRMGQDTRVTADVTARYRANGLANADLAGSTVYLATVDGSQAVRSVSGRLALGTTDAATAYRAQSATLADNGDLNGLALVNAVTGGYVSYGSYLNDTGTIASSYQLIKRADGHYALSVNGRYVVLTTTGSYLSTSVSAATGLVLYTTDTVDGTTDQALSLPGLAAPDVQTANLQVLDTRAQIDVIGSDPDSTMLRNAAGQTELYVSVYRTDDMSLVKQVQVTALSQTGVTLSGLVGGVDYTLQVHGGYNLGAGDGDQDQIWFSTEFVTDQSLPSLTSGPTLTWNVGCGTGGRAVAVVAGWDDPSAVLTGVQYQWYKKTAAFDGVDLTNTSELAAAIAASGQSPVYTFDAGLDAGTAMPMDSDGKRNFFAGQDYVIAVSMLTTLPDAPEYLVTGRSLRLSGPASASGTLTVDTVSQSGATATFTVSDAGHYLTCADPMTFSYTLTPTGSSGSPVDTGSFTVARSTSGPPALTFTGLEPGTSYTLTITGAADDLKENGARTWSIARSFATADEFVTTNAVTFVVAGDTGTAAATNVQSGAADAITAARFELYRIDNYGQADQVNTLVDTRAVAVPADGGTVSTDFDLAQHGTGIYFSRLVLTYTVSGSTYQYTRDSIGRDFTPGTSVMSAFVTGRMLWLDASELSDGDLTVVATDSAGNVLADTTVTSTNGDTAIPLDATAPDLTVEVTDSDGEVARISGVTGPSTTSLLSPNGVTS